jgi:hypothetical protein
VAREAHLTGYVPEGPVDFPEVISRFPVLRQSLGAKFDDCELSALFELRYANGWSTHPQAAGTLVHRFCAECLRTMREHDTEGITWGVAAPILEEVVYQRGIPARERVRVPMRDMPLLEMACAKWVADNHFTVRNIVDIERRLEHPLMVPHWETGELYERVLSGEPDAVIAADANTAIVLDWKHTWALPPERDDDADEPGLSYHGFFQQMWYGWLILKQYPGVERVILREFYVRRTKRRQAAILRKHMDRVERRLRALISSMDRAIQVGEPENLKLETLEALGSWIPSPGKHCGYCASSWRCPIEEAYRGDGGIETPEDAAAWAARRSVAKSIHKRADQVLMPYAELHGPIPIKSAKGARVLGYRQIKGGKVRWDEYTPVAARDVPRANPADVGDVEGLENAPVINLEAAMRASIAEARAERDES